MLTILLVFVAMAAKDVFTNISVYLVSHGHGWWGSFADGVSDVAAALSLGVTGAVTVLDGLSWFTVGAFAALLAGSVLGGGVGTILGKRFSDRLDGGKP